MEDENLFRKGHLGHNVYIIKTCTWHVAIFSLNLRHTPLSIYQMSLKVSQQDLSILQQPKHQLPGTTVK